MSLNFLKWSMSVIISDSGSLRACARRSIALASAVVEELAVGERGERVGQALVADRLEILLKLVDFLLRGVEPLPRAPGCSSPSPWWPAPGFRRSARTAVAVGGDAELLGDVDQALGVARRGAGGGVDHGHDLLDLAHDAASRPSSMRSVKRVGEMIGVVDLFDIGVGQSVPLRASISLIV